MKICFLKDYENPNNLRETTQQMIDLAKAVKGIHILRETEHFIEMNATPEAYNLLKVIQDLEYTIMVEGGERELKEYLKPYVYDDYLTWVNEDKETE